MPALKVLVVDDDEQYLRLTARVLRDAGYDVVTRTDVIGTAYTVTQEKPDLVLIDVNMPLLTGDRLTELLQRSVRERPLIVLHSGEDEKTLAQRAAACGADASIPKGLTVNRLLQRLARVARQRRAPPRPT